MMKKNVVTKAFVFSLCIIIFAFTSVLSDDTEEIVNSLQQWSRENPQEKVYLHTDKPYYLVGDTIWLKAYLTAGSQNQLSSISGAIYVDMIAEGDSITQSLKLPVTAGMATASLILHDSTTREGNYRIRAYTQWMRNAGPDYFYDRTFSVGNSVTNAVFAKVEYLQVKENGKELTKARVTYTDNNGKAYAGKAVSYAWKESYKTISSGGGKTGGSGELLIMLPSKPADSLQARYLVNTIQISDKFSVNKTFPIQSMARNVDLQFFPEGGSMLNGVRNRIAFKALANSGLGTSIKGVVFDEQNQEIVQFESAHLGMGAFYMMPESGRSYSAKCTFADGTTRIIPLPEAAEKGYLLSVFGGFGLHRDSVLVRISTNSATLAEGQKSLSLIGQHGAAPFFATEVRMGQQQISLYFRTDEVPTGIMQFTLFASGQPICERLSFIESQDRIDLQIKGPKDVVAKRAAVELKVEARSPQGQPLAGNFSMSVVSESAVPSDEANENSIFAQLLLSADIKGYIEKPNYYFQEATESRRTDLDLLLMTQGYRRFKWAQLLNNDYHKPAFRAEPLINDVSGKLLTLNNQPVKAGKVTLISNKLNLILDTLTEPDGTFKFGNLFITHGVDFTIQGKTAKGKSRLQVQIENLAQPAVSPNKNHPDMNPNIPELIKVSLDNSKKQEFQLEKLGVMTRTQQLREVQIRASKPWGYKNRVNDSQADEVFRPDRRRPCSSLLECLTESDHTRMKFIQVIDSSDTQCGAIWRAKGTEILVDDVWIRDPCDFQTLLLDDCSDIDKVQVLTMSNAMKAKVFGPYLPEVLKKYKNSLPNVIAIYTKSGNFRKVYDPSVVYYAPKGYDNTKEFYAPKYDRPEQHVIADLRTTIYWNPAVLTRGLGQAWVHYYNADQIGSYRVTVEGIDAKGRLGRAIYRYQVN